MKEINLLDLFKSIWKKRIAIMIWAGVALAIGVVIALSLPRQYTTTAKVVLEGKNDGNSAAGSMGALAELMGVNVGGGTKSGITADIYPQIIASSPFLNDMAKVIVPFDGQKITLYEYLTKKQKAPWWGFILGFPSKIMSIFSSSAPDETMPNEQNDQFAVKSITKEQNTFEMALKSLVQFKEDKNTKIINVDVIMQDPKIAVVVADSLLYKLQYFVVKYNTSKTRWNLENSLQMCETARQKYYSADSVYAHASDRNQNFTTQTARIKIEKLLNEKNVAYAVYQQLANQVEVSRIKLLEDTPIATVIEPARKPLTPSAPNRKLIVIGMLLAGAFIKILIVAIRFIYNSSNTDVQSVN